MKNAKGGVWAERCYLSSGGRGGAPTYKSDWDALTSTSNQIKGLSVTIFLQKKGDHWVTDPKKECHWYEIVQSLGNLQNKFDFFLLFTKLIKKKINK